MTVKELVRILIEQHSPDSTVVLASDNEGGLFSVLQDVVSGPSEQFCFSDDKQSKVVVLYP
jgi:hypothetical protein